MAPDSPSSRRGWNGYGLSFWSCKCGARRRVTKMIVRGERISEVVATPCKRCGDEGQPAGWPSDPWLGFEEALMYGRTPEAAEMRQETTLEAMRREIGGCREEVGTGKCWEPAEYVLWGKLTPAEALGPRCYDHAADHVGHRALEPGANYALVNLVDLAKKIDRAHQDG